MSNPKARDAPRDTEIEVSLFGRGMGEAILIHLGDQEWVLIDCLMDADGNVAPLRYLDSIGVNVASALKLIVATHWHDDHVRGLSEVYLAAPTARLALPAAMRQEEMQAFINEASKINAGRFTSGVSELKSIADARKLAAREKFVLGIANRALLRSPAANFSHACDVGLEALSPSDADVAAMIAALATRSASQNLRAVPFSPNDVSIALWLKIGDHRVLFGADLEEHGKSDRGWKAVVASPARPEGKAAIFKVPHHGSQNGHNPDVWNELVSHDPVSVLTTYNRGKPLPTNEDSKRILQHSPQSYITRGKANSPPRAAVVTKMMRVARAKTTTWPDEAGQVRLRLDLAKQQASWSVELLNGARHLKEEVVSS